MNRAILFLLIMMTGCRQNEHLKKDWAYLKRYAAENAKLPLPDPNDNRVVFMGNSITDGWEFNHPDFFKNNHYINRGIGGQTTSQMLLRFRQDVIQLKPKAVVILAGTGDIAQNTGPITVEQIAGNIISMTELAKANGIEPVLCSVLPVRKYYWKKTIDPVPLIRELNDLVRSYCITNNIVYVDFYSSLVNHESGIDWKYAPDGLHPNKEGYKIMEPLVEKGIAEALSK